VKSTIATMLAGVRGPDAFWRVIDAYPYKARCNRWRSWWDVAATVTEVPNDKKRRDRIWRFRYTFAELAQFDGDRPELPCLRDARTVGATSKHRENVLSDCWIARTADAWAVLWWTGEHPSDAWRSKPWLLEQGDLERVLACVPQRHFENAVEAFPTANVRRVQLRQLSLPGGL